jgi:YfiH family protein
VAQLAPSRKGVTPALSSALLAAVPGVRHGFFTRQGIPSTGLLAAPVMVRQVHSARAIEVTTGAREACAVEPADALWCCERGVAIAVRTADCVPMLATTDDGALVLAIHGGWRGLAAGVIEAAVAALSARGYAAQRLRVAIGPHIGPCCYRVGDEVVAALGPASRIERRGELFADLGAAARERWQRVGVVGDRIDLVDPCTACDAGRFASYRRDHGGPGRQLSVIALEPT